VDPDLLGWTPADSPDARHETTDQKVAALSRIQASIRCAR
jgi:hypothetical protein